MVRSAKPSRTEPRPKEAIVDWVSRTGFPLELRAARVLRKLDFDFVGLGEYFWDESSEIERECDVIGVARLDRVSTPGAPEVKTPEVNLTFLIECKYVRDNPWITLIAERQFSLTGFFTAYPANTGGLKFLKSVLTQVEETDFTSALVPLEVGYKVIPFAPEVSGPFPKQEESKGRPDRMNVPFHALQSILRAAQARTKLDREGVTSALTPELVVPIIIVDGQLYECRLTRGKQTRLKRVRHTQVVRTGWNVGRQFTLVHLMELGQLEGFAELVRSLYARFLKASAGEFAKALQKDGE